MDSIFSFGGLLDRPEILVVKFLAASVALLLAILVFRGPTGLRAVVDRIDHALVVIAQITIVGLMALLFVAILLRATFGIFSLTIPDASLFSQMLMVAVVFFTAANAQKIGAHIEVTAIADLLPANVNLAFRLFALSVGVVIMGGAAWFSAIRAAEDFYSGAIVYSSILYLVEWPGRAIVPLGLAWWTLRMAMQIFIPAERYENLDHVQDRLDKVG